MGGFGGVPYRLRCFLWICKLCSRNVSPPSAAACAQTRTNVVFGQGVPNAEVLFVGEGPGASEDEQGLPFVGRPAASCWTLS